MDVFGGGLEVHPAGEVEAEESLAVDTHGRRIHVEWDPASPVTPLGQLVFFSQFLATGGLFSHWVERCPLRFSSPNAPSLTNLLGTITLSVLAGQFRYAHVTGLRADTVNPVGLGMSKVCSEDSVRRAFAGADAKSCADWQLEALRKTWLPALHHPWVLDLDVTVKPIYGHQDGAELGYNPHKPGRPSHAYHTLMVRHLRLVLDVEVHPGKEHAAGHGRSNLWRLWESLPAECRPALLCGDAAYGQEALLKDCEDRGQKYLFRQRQTQGVKQLIQSLGGQGRLASDRQPMGGLGGLSETDRLDPRPEGRGAAANEGSGKPKAKGIARAGAGAPTRTDHRRPNSQLRVPDPGDEPDLGVAEPCGPLPAESRQ